ncbi:glycogen debranching protein GlgX [Rhizobium rhizoryzae]|uniref:glycogen debranching protein GlgX n=1 Tax=Rhizobium rhizoryzae TaxID=451876 RepID=UPI00289B2A1D|nr:glycogen debranching protein GlgX [Rhizobium rhizoryzae]
MQHSFLGAILSADGVTFAVQSTHATGVEVCIFDAEGRQELQRLPMTPQGYGRFTLAVPGLGEGTRYGLRASGPHDPDRGLWFDPAKLLVDPYAKELDRPYTYDPRLSEFGLDTGDLVPKAIVTADRPVTSKPPVFCKGGLIYELGVRPFTMLHPDVPQHERGTLKALAHPSVIAHLKRIGVDAVELLPITAWIDERHLPPLGLTNGWGYNPVTFMALDPRLAPGGMAELSETVAELHRHGIGVILDLVFNHTGESDRYGATLSFRGLDNPSLYRHQPDNPGALINDTGTGNTVACDHSTVRRMIVDTLRHFVLNAGVDGFRFDLGTILGRSHEGFSRHSDTLLAITQDELLAHRILIAEPWDIGPGGYQLGNFPTPFLEWNDRARDDMRCYWRGDPSKTGTLANALAGSSDIFSSHGETETRTVNFIAAHDGFTLMDLVSYAHKHNEANGEDNRDGHNENHSWNNGIEGTTPLSAVVSGRKRDVKALLSTLFSTRGTIMLTAGDEGGRSQQGNNNAYAQDNEITWLDWRTLDEELLAHTAELAAIRRRFAAFADLDFFHGDGDIAWLNELGEPMTIADWEQPERTQLTMLLQTLDRDTQTDVQLAIVFNRSSEVRQICLPEGAWNEVLGDRPQPEEGFAPRSVTWLVSQEH